MFHCLVWELRNSTLVEMYRVWFACLASVFLVFQINFKLHFTVCLTIPSKWLYRSISTDDFYLCYLNLCKSFRYRKCNALAEKIDRQCGRWHGYNSRIQDKGKITVFIKNKHWTLIEYFLTLIKLSNYNWATVSNTQIKATDGRDYIHIQRILTNINGH